MAPTYKARSGSTLLFTRADLLRVNMSKVPAVAGVPVDYRKLDNPKLGGMVSYGQVNVYAPARVPANCATYEMRRTKKSYFLLNVLWSTDQ